MGWDLVLTRFPDGHIYLTTATAATVFGVDHSTVSNWRRRNLLTPAYVVRNRPLYRLQDVAEAERLAREAAIRTSGSSRRVARRGKLAA